MLAVTAMDRLFPAGVVVVEATARDFVTPVDPVEEDTVARAVAKRRCEFRAGRHCAHRALQALGAPVGPIPVGSRRQPLWPDGVVGTITHSGTYAAAAVAPSRLFDGIGLDAEPTGALEDHLIPLVSTPRERRPAPARPDWDWPTALFVAKEAVYKAVNPATGVALDFPDVEVTVDETTDCFTADVVASPLSGLRLSGRLLHSRGHIHAGVTVPPGALRC